MHAREPFRHHSFLSPACAGIIVGFGVAGYALAIDGLARTAKTRAAPAMIEKQVASLAEAVADVADGATVMIGGFGTAGLPNELVGALLEQGAQRPDDRQQQRRQRRHRPGGAARGAPGAQDRLLVPAPDRQPPLRPPLPRRRDRARAGAARQPRRAHPRRRRRHRRLLHADRLRHRARQGQGDARDRRPHVRARIAAPRRLRASSRPSAATAGATSPTA